MGQIFTKFGQLLSTRTDILDVETAKDLESLTDSCKPFNVETLKKIVESELGDSIENIFESFDEKPLAAASLAQVHSATLSNGDHVVVKVLRPNIHKKVKRNLRLLKSAAKIFSYIYSESYNISFVDPYATKDGVSLGYNVYFRETDYGEFNVANYLTNSNGLGVQFGYPISDICLLYTSDAADE